MKIGIDLDDTLYTYPDFFREFIVAMTNAGHQLYCTSNHTLDEWERRDKRRLTELDIMWEALDPSLMSENVVESKNGIKNKVKMANQLDLVFDDHGAHFQGYTKTPIFIVPKPFSCQQLEIDDA